MGAGSATQRIDPGGPGGAFPAVEPDSWGQEGALGTTLGAGSATQRLDPGGPGGAFPAVEPDSWGRECALQDDHE